MSVALAEHPTQLYQSSSETYKVIDFNKVKLGETIGGYSFDALEADRLAKLDLNQKRAEVSKNLEGFRGEVLDDVPVSHRYHYYFDHDGNVYNHPDRESIHRFESQFDPRERDGLPQIGFRRATQMMFRNPNKTVLWYSPPGAASKDKSPDNPYADVTFIYGQLYVMSYDGERINGVAVKVDREGEGAIDQFMPDRFYAADECKTDYERIGYFLQNPTILAGTINEFTNHNWFNGRVYAGKGDGATNKNFTIAQMMKDIQTQMSKDSSVSLFSSLVENMSEAQLSDRTEIAKLYLTMITNHPSMRKNGKMSLQGACGGSIATLQEIEAQLGIHTLEPISSAYRLMTQTDLVKTLVPSNDLLNKYKTHHEDYTCPGCKKTLSGESVSDKKSWRKNCEHCNYAFGC